MASFSFDLADRSDDAALRALLRETSMPGAIKIAFGREPSFFDSLATEGRFQEVVVCRHNGGHRIVGMGCRSVKPAFLNGEPGSLGYLSSLRLLPEVRGAQLLARGYRFLRDRTADSRADFYLTTIVEGNDSVRVVLTSGRCGLPAYRDFGRFCCVAIGLGGRRKRRMSSTLTLRAASPEDVPVLVDFLNAEGSAKQFFPHYCARDFNQDGGLLKDLSLTDVLLAFDGGKLRGAIAAWDQRGFRQTRIAGYGWPACFLRHPWNFIAGAAGYPTLPRGGECLDAVHLSLVCIAGNDPEVFSTMLGELVTRLGSRHAVMLAGFHETDPLLDVLRRHRHISYASRLFVVSFGDDWDKASALDLRRIPYLELGSL